MDHDSTENPDVSGPPATQRGSKTGSRQPDLPPQETAAAGYRPRDTPIPTRTTRRGCRRFRRSSSEAVAEGPLAVGHAAIEHAVRHAPTSPGVYRMLNAANDVLYVGKAKNVRKRLTSYAGLPRCSRRASCA